MPFSRSPFASPVFSVATVFLLAVVGVSGSSHGQRQHQARQEQQITVINTVTVTTASTVYASYAACQPTLCPVLTNQTSFNLTSDGDNLIKAIEIDTLLPLADIQAQSLSLSLSMSTSISIESQITSEAQTSTEPEPTVSYTTISIDPSITITGVQMKVVESPTSCYALPIPTDDLAKVSVSEDPIVLFVGNDGTKPYYMGSWLADFFFLVDGTDMEGHKLTLVQPNSYSIGFHPDGITISSISCDWQVDVSVQNFFEQIEFPLMLHYEPIVDGPSPMSDFLENFDVTVNYPNKHTDTEPALTMGGHPCNRSVYPFGEDENDWYFTCHYHGPESPSGICEANMFSMLEPSFELFPVMSNHIDYLDYIAPFFVRAQHAILPLLPELDPPLSLAADWLAQNHNVDDGYVYANAVCSYLHPGDTYNLVFSDDGVEWSISTYQGFFSPEFVHWVVPENEAMV